jgi:uncharacterized membrane protein HdeD (DUF308 family)
MRNELADLAVSRWWAFVLRGIAAVLFGILTFVMPGMALLTLVFLVGVYALVEGAVNLTSAIRRTGPPGKPHWPAAVEGVASIIVGLAAFFVPRLTALGLLALIAAWSLVRGVLEVAAAIRLRQEIKGEWMLALSGVLSIAFGILLFMFPGAGALAVVLWIGAYAVVFGGVLIALGLKLRTWARTGRPHTGMGEFAPSPSR